MYFQFQQNGEGHRCVCSCRVYKLHYGCCSVVSHRWLKSSTQCRWPGWQSSSKLARAVQNHVAPESDWKLYEVKILKATGQYTYTET